MTPYMKYTTAKLVYILNNLDQFTKKEVIYETINAVDLLTYSDEGLSTDQEQAFRLLAMAIQDIKCADC